MPTATSTRIRHEAVKPSVVSIARFGWFAKGVVYVLAGVLAGSIAVRSFNWTVANGPEGEASPTGALKEVATFPGGTFLLVGLALGLFLYAGWRLVTATRGEPGGPEALAKRVGYIVSFVLYTSFGITALVLSRSPTESVDGDRTARDLTARVLEHGWGRWILGGVGLIVVGVGIYRITKGVRGDVFEEMNTSGFTPLRRRIIGTLGRVGEIGRGVAIGLIGYFLVRVGVTSDAEEGTGLDDALRRFASTTWGGLLVGVVGIGFVSYGLFCLVTFPRRELRSPS